MIVKPFWDAKSYQLFFNVVLLLHLVNIVWFCTIIEVGLCGRSQISKCVRELSLLTNRRARGHFYRCGREGHTFFQPFNGGGCHSFLGRSDSGVTFFFSKFKSWIFWKEKYAICWNFLRFAQYFHKICAIFS